MPKRKAKKKAAVKTSYLDQLVVADHRVETSQFRVSSEFHDWLDADLKRLEAAWPHVGAVGVARDRLKWADLGVIESAADSSAAS